MSIFPTKILLATDGSKEAKLAFASAADLSEKTGSELHVVYVGHMPPRILRVSGRLRHSTRNSQDRMGERAEEGARTKLEEEVQRVRAGRRRGSGGTREAWQARCGDRGTG